MSRVYLKQKMSILESIPYDEIKKPSNIPVVIYLREANELIQVGRKDQAALEEVGYESEMLDELAIRAGALREAESLWRNIRFCGNEDRRRWDEALPQGYRLFEQLRAALIFALRRDRAAVKMVREATKGGGPAALIQGLNNLLFIAREKREELQAIRFEPDRLAEASAMVKRLATQLGAADSERAGVCDALRLRNAAYTHLYEGLKELREYGLYLFRDEKEQSLRYTSDYLRKKRNNRRKRGERHRANCNKVGLKRVECGPKAAESGMNTAGERMNRPISGMSLFKQSMKAIHRDMSGLPVRTNSFVKSMKAFKRAINSRK